MFSSINTDIASKLPIVIVVLHFSYNDEKKILVSGQEKISWKLDLRLLIFCGLWLIDVGNTFIYSGEVCL